MAEAVEVDRFRQFIGRVTAGVEAYRAISAPTVPVPAPSVAPVPAALPTAAVTPPPTIKTVYGNAVIAWPVALGLAGIALLLFWR